MSVNPIFATLTHMKLSPLSPQLIFRLGAGLMALGIVLGAFGAHGLKSHVSAQMLANFETGVRYQIYVALALFALGCGVHRHNQAQNQIGLRAPWALMAGCLIFSGSLYIMTLTGMRWLGAITPIGGTLLIGGFVWLLFEYRRP